MVLEGWGLIIVIGVNASRRSESSAEAGRKEGQNEPTVLVASVREVKFACERHVASRTSPRYPSRGGGSSLMRLEIEGLILRRCTSRCLKAPIKSLPLSRACATFSFAAVHP